MRTQQRVHIITTDLDSSSAILPFKIFYLIVLAASLMTQKVKNLLEMQDTQV